MVHSSHVGNGLLWIHGPHRSFDHLDGAPRIIRRPHDQNRVPLRLLLLRNRYVHRRFHLVQKSALPNVANNSHHRPPGVFCFVLVAAEADAFAHRAAAGPVTLGKKFIHNHCQRPAFMILFPQQAAFFHFRAQHLQVTGRHFTVERVVVLSCRQRRFALYYIAIGVSYGHERRVGPKSRSLHSRQCTYVFHHGVEKSEHLFARVVLLFGQRHSHRQQMIGLKSQFLLSQIPDGLDHHSGAYQQSKGQRKLAHHQRIPQTQSAARFSPAASVLKRLLQGHARGPQRRCETKQHSRHNRDSGSE